MIDVDRDGNPRYEDALKVAAGRHELSVIRVTDPREKSLPDVGLVHVKDSEGGGSAWIDTASKSVRERYAQWFQTVSEREKHLFNKYQIDSVDIATDGDYVRGLMSLFQRK